MQPKNKLPLILALALAAISLLGAFVWTYEAYRTASSMAGLVWLAFPVLAGIAIVLGFATGWLIGTGINFSKARRAGVPASEAPINKPIVYLSSLLLSIAVFYGAWSAYELHLQKLVYSPATSPQVLDDLSRNVFVRRSAHLEEYLTRHSSTGSEALARLYESERVLVRSNVCKHAAVSPAILARCVAESDINVLGGVARNPNTPADVVKSLSQHSSYTIRSAIGFRPDIGPEIIDRLSRDEHEEVRGSILFHQQLPEEVLARLANDPAMLVRVRVAANKKTPLPALLTLARDPEHTVRWELLWDKAPKQVLELLANDPQERVQRRAQYLLHN